MKTSRAENWLVVLIASTIAIALILVPRLLSSDASERSDLISQSRVLAGAFMRGDERARETLMVQPPGDATGALTPAGAAQAMGSDPSFSLNESAVSVSKFEATVPIDLHTPAGDVRLGITWTRGTEDGRWEVKPVSLPRIDVSSFAGEPTTTFVVNGEKVAPAITTNGLRTFPVWPGVASIHIVNDSRGAWPQAGPERFELKQFSAPSTPVQQGTRLPRPGYTAALSSEAKKTIQAYFDRCAAASPSNDLDCPFAPAVQHTPAQMRNVKFSQPAMISDPTIDTKGATSIYGEVTVSADVKSGDSWKRTTVKSQFLASGTLLPNASGDLTFTLDDKTTNRVQQKWAAAATDWGSRQGEGATV